MPEEEKQPKIRIKPPEPDICESEPFSDKLDIFGFKDFAESMARLACGIALPSTLVLDGPWGSGKTVFIKQWRHLVEKEPHNARVIYFDAFAHDFRQDPFVALTTEFAKKFGQSEELKKAAIQAGKSIVPTLAGAGANALTAGVLGKSVETFLKDQFDDVDEEEQRLQEFKKALESLAQPQEGQGPFILIIDELDRCRPDFALASLELIKHVFSVPGICVVLVTNLEHMASVVLGRYGADMDGATYLRKFYDITLTLPEHRSFRLGDRLQQYAAWLWPKMGLNERLVQGAHNVDDDILRIARLHECSLRDLERIAAQYSVFLETIRTEKKLDNFALVAGLCLVRVIAPDLFRKAVDDRLSEADVRSFFHFDDISWNDHEAEWFKDMWLYVTSEELSEEVLSGLNARNVSLRDRRHYLLSTARRMANFRMPD